MYSLILSICHFLMVEPRLPAEKSEPDTDFERVNELKLEGNTAFGEKQYEKAIECYDQALNFCASSETEIQPVLLSNRAACRISLEEYEAAAEDCTLALTLNPDYVKAYLRRFTAYEQQQKWHEAVNDIKKAEELDPSIEPTYRNRKERAERESNKLFEKEKEEMMGKLKDFGNMMLGKVGLSLDNFSVNQNADGGYNISFNQGQNSSS